MCRCDPGYTGKSCATSIEALPRFLQEDFKAGVSHMKWGWVGGGTTGVACGVAPSKHGLVFNVGRSRLLETVDLDLTKGVSIAFTIEMGFETSRCPHPSDYTKSVFVQYSKNGGITWTTLRNIIYNSSSLVQVYDLPLPRDSKTTSTRIRWYQPTADGANRDVWAVANVSIDSDKYTFACASSPCVNQGICIDELGGGYSCRCGPRFSGRTCEVIVLPCSSYPCVNGGFCTNLGFAFHCNCLPGFTGENCERDIDECSRNPCTHGGTCTDAINDYSCQCTFGTTGRQCQIDIDECLSNPCQNGGTCQQSDIGQYVCICSQYHTGLACETPLSPCDVHSSYCHNGGTCFGTSGSANVKCLCPKGFRGQQCKQKHDRCQSTVGLCRNGGSCINTMVGHYCVCPSSTTGVNCETDILSPCSLDPCQNGGTCVGSFDNSYVCSCLPGFTGKNCDVDINECHSSPCRNGGRCIDNVNSFHCDCNTTAHEGILCETKSAFLKAALDFCLSTNTCKNGLCTSGDETTFACVCRRDQQGTQCDASLGVEHCQSVVCENDRICHNGICYCLPGYTGPHCIGDINDSCNGRDCEENLVCINQLASSGFSCSCRSELSKTRCTCDINPCQNDGNCTLGETLGRYQCRCTAGYAKNVTCTAVDTNDVQITNDSQTDNDKKSWPGAVGGVVAVLALLCVIAGIFIYRRRRRSIQEVSSNANVYASSPSAVSPPAEIEMSSVVEKASEEKEFSKGRELYLPMSPAVSQYQNWNSLYGGGQKAQSETRGTSTRQYANIPVGSNTSSRDANQQTTTQKDEKEYFYVGFK